MSPRTGLRAVVAIAFLSELLGLLLLAAAIVSDAPLYDAAADWLGYSIPVWLIADLMGELIETRRDLQAWAEQALRLSRWHSRSAAASEPRA